MDDPAYLAMRAGDEDSGTGVGPEVEMDAVLHGLGYGLKPWLENLPDLRFRAAGPPGRPGSVALGNVDVALGSYPAGFLARRG